MPYSEWDDVNAAIKGIEPRVTLAQANKIAEWADSMDEDAVENVWAAAIAQFKKLYKVEDDKWVKREAEASEFFFAEFEEGKPVEFLRTGTFVDRNGREVEVTADFLDELVSNFEGGEAGQEVPIDVKHEKSEAAGWVRRVWRDGNRLLANVDWNTVGRDLVGERVYRYLSATIDTAQNVLKSISLVNFPAVKGLQPVELSEGVYTMAAKQGLLGRIQEAIRAVFEEVEAEEIETDEEELEQEETETEEESQEGDMNEEEVKKLLEQAREDALVEFEEKRVELEEEIREEVREEEQAKLELEAERREFVEEATEGEVALGVEPDELLELALSMDEEQFEGLKKALNAKIVEFGERGSSRSGQAGKEKLEPVYVGQLREFINAGRTKEEWFEMNEDILGPMDQYDLSEFVEEEE